MVDEHNNRKGKGLAMTSQLSTTVTEELTAAYQLLETALGRIDSFGLGQSHGRKLDQVRWLLGDLIADMTPTTEPADIDGAGAFTTAAERGQ